MDLDHPLWLIAILIGVAIFVLYRGFVMIGEALDEILKELRRP